MTGLCNKCITTGSKKLLGWRPPLLVASAVQVQGSLASDAGYLRAPNPRPEINNCHLKPFL